MRQCRFVYKSISREKSCSSHWEISISWTSQKYDDVTTPYYPIFRSINRQLLAYGRLNTEKNFKLLAPKVVAFAYERWSLTRGSKYSDLTWKHLVFWLRRGDRLREVVATGGSTAKAIANKVTKSCVNPAKWNVNWLQMTYTYTFDLNHAIFFLWNKHTHATKATVDLHFDVFQVKHDAIKSNLLSALLPTSIYWVTTLRFQFTS